jgi:hypothetical protein
VREQAEGRGADAPYLQAVRRHEERTATMLDLADSAQNVDLGRQGKEQTKAQSKTSPKKNMGWL